MLYSKYHKDYYTKDVEATDEQTPDTIELVEKEVEKPKKPRRRRASKKPSTTKKS